MLIWDIFWKNIPIRITFRQCKISSCVAKQKAYVMCNEVERTLLARQNTLKCGEAVSKFLVGQNIHMGSEAVLLVGQNIHMCSEVVRTLFVGQNILICSEAVSILLNRKYILTIEYNIDNLIAPSLKYISEKLFSWNEPTLVPPVVMVQYEVHWSDSTDYTCAALVSTLITLITRWSQRPQEVTRTFYRNFTARSGNLCGTNAFLMQRWYLSELNFSFCSYYGIRI